MTDNDLSADSPSSAERSVWALCPDLVFAARIRGTAGDVGVSVRVVRAAAQLLEGLEELARADAVAAAPAAGGVLALIDLAAARDAEEAIRAVKERFPTVTVVAFAPHVATDRIEAARSAGADRVLARSAFVARLPELLAGA